MLDLDTTAIKVGVGANALLGITGTTTLATGLSDPAWVPLWIAVVGTVQVCILAWINKRSENRTQGKINESDMKASDERVEVKKTLETVTAKQDERIRQIANVATDTHQQVAIQSDKLEAIAKNTNSLVVQLVETTKSEAHAAGVKDEHDRQAGAGEPR